MAKNTSILRGDYFTNFISEQVTIGMYSSDSEVVRAALRVLEFEEVKKNELIKELKKGEKSGFIQDFDETEFLRSMHKKHSRDEL